ncbi:MAG: hypothetical protein QM786_11490 [Breznakibacter sp.]
MHCKYFPTLVLLAVSVTLSAQSRTKQIEHKIQVNGNNQTHVPANKADAPLVDWVKQTTRAHSPQSWDLLVQYDLLPSKLQAVSDNGSTSSYQKPIATYHFLEGNTKNEMLQSMGTNVHEVAHAYFRHNAVQYAIKHERKIDWNNAEGYIYVSPSQSFFVSFPKQRMFQSKDLATAIPSGLRTLRFPTYIQGNTSTQSHGVIGLLNEFHAYYLGAKYSYDMMEVYCEAGPSAAKGFLTWVQHTQSSMDAYYELSFFIREYLLYMSQHHPKSYAMLKGHHPFWQAFRAIDKAFADLNKQYARRIRQEIPAINANGKNQLAIEGSMLWFDNGSDKRIGVSLTLKAKQTLSDRLNSKRYDKVME